MKKQNWLLVLLLWATWSASAQTYKISGRVLDATNKPLEFANVLLGKFSATQPFKSVASDSLGQFTFEGIKPDTYRIALMMVGYTTGLTACIVKDQNVGVDAVTLLDEIRNLNEVVVTSTRPFIEQKVDKLVVNVSSSILSAGATVFEVLQRVPGVVILNDKIEIAGKSNVGIMIDGKLSQYMDMNAVLRDMPSNNIEKIEVITNPSAKYDAAGGALINVITKKDKSLGFTGNVSLSTGYAYFDQKNINSDDNNYYRYTPSVNLTYRAKKWGVFGYYNALNRRSFDAITINRFVGTSEFNAVTYTPKTELSHTYRAGFDYFINSKNTVGVVINGFDRTGESRATNTTDYTFRANSVPITGRFLTTNDADNHRYNFSANTNFKHTFDSTGQEITADVDYLTYQLTTLSTIKSTPSVSDNIKHQDVDNPIQIAMMKADYTKPFRQEWLFEAGIKSSFATINNRLTFRDNETIDNLRSNTFLYQENIYASYVNLQKKWLKWRFQGGVRFEQTRATGSSLSERVLDRNYGQFFYNAYASRKLVSELALNLSFNQRIDRPSFQQQNPFEFFMDSLSFTRGNPFLRPQKTSVAKLSLTYAGSPCFAVSYNKTDDVIFENAPLQEGNKTYTIVDNLGRYESVNIEANFPITIGKIVSGYGGNQVIMNRYAVDYLGSTYNRTKWNWLGYIQISFKLSNTLSAEVYGYYMTPFVREFMDIQKSSTVNIGVQKTFWDKKGKLSLNINDLLYQNPILAHLDYQGIQFDYQQRNDSRNIRLTFSYKLGSKQVKQRKDKTSASESEQNRVKFN
jgi:hypothetical protein